jgi:hypothetical protein
LIDHIAAVLQLSEVMSRQFTRQHDRRNEAATIAQVCRHACPRGHEIELLEKQFDLCWFPLAGMRGESLQRASCQLQDDR